MSYAGDISPEQAHTRVTAEADAVIVDVRTAAEWAWVGSPDLSAADGRYLQIEWNHSDGQRNTGFLDDLAAAGIPADAAVMFLCRSGARSQAAASAATDAGFGNALNIADGFEGGVDDQGHRGSTGGWKAAGLPWKQT